MVLGDGQEEWARIGWPALQKRLQSSSSPRKSEAIGDEMKGKRFTTEQIIGILNEAEQTASIREPRKRNNVEKTTFCRGRSKFGARRRTAHFPRIRPGRI